MIENRLEITRVNLAYRDRFLADNWSCEVDKKKSLESLFNKESKFIPTNIFESAYPWHSHHGFFEESQVGKYKILHNINTGLVCHGDEKNGQDTYSAEVYISTEMSCVFDSEDCIPLNYKETADMFEILHDRCKDVVRNLLTNDVLHRIGINDHKLDLAESTVRSQQ